MKLYRISQSQNNGYDTYDSAVVCAENEEDAKNMLPFKNYTAVFFNENYNNLIEKEYFIRSRWAMPEYVKVEYLGEAKENLVKKVICRSFNAG